VAGGGMTVLIVEDLDLLRRLFVATISSEGETAMAVASYEEALSAAERGVSLVITDLELFGRSGLDLLRELRKRWPDLPVACMSSDGALLGEAREAGAHALLQKPFLLDDLRLVVRLLLLQAELPEPFRP